MLYFITTLATAVSTPASIIRVPGGHAVPASCITALNNRGTYDASAANHTFCDDTRLDCANDSDLRRRCAFKEPRAAQVFHCRLGRSAGAKVVLWSGRVFLAGFKAMAPEMGYPFYSPSCNSVSAVKNGSSNRGLSMRRTVASQS